jgi:CO dehydrogenase/acetyl-CoA synthase gamma subunit (corrinoid Fe-S protein)
LVQILHPQRNFQNSTCLFLNISDMTKNKVITGLKNEIRNYEKFKADELRTS